MAVINMTRVAFTEGGSSGLFHNTVVISAGAVSDIYQFPFHLISEISANIDGDGAIEFTNDPPVVLESGSPTWVEWDGFSRINTALTAFRVTRATGTVTAKVTIRTQGA